MTLGRGTDHFIFEDGGGGGVRGWTITKKSPEQEKLMERNSNTRKSREKKISSKAKKIIAEELTVET